MIRCSQKKTHFQKSSFLTKTGIKIPVNQEFENIRELEIYSWYFDHFTPDTDHFRWRVNDGKEFLLIRKTVFNCDLKYHEHKKFKPKYSISVYIEDFVFFKEETKCHRLEVLKT